MASVADEQPVHYTSTSTVFIEYKLLSFAEDLQNNIFDHKRFIMRLGGARAKAVARVRATADARRAPHASRVSRREQEVGTLRAGAHGCGQVHYTLTRPMCFLTPGACFLFGIDALAAAHSVCRRALGQLPVRDLGLGQVSIFGADGPVGPQARCG